MYTNSELTYQQREIIDSKSKRGFWLFDVVTVGLTTYRWTDFSSKVWDGNTYTFKIVAMSDLEEIDVGPETGIISISNMTFEIENAGNAINPADLAGATVTVRAILGTNLAGGFAAAGDDFDDADDAFETPDYQEVQAFAWEFKIISAKHSGEQSITVECENWLAPYLRGEYPNTKLLQDEFPDDIIMDDMCVPKIWGTAYIPVRSVWDTTKRYYCLGPSGVTYTISEVRAPREYGSTVFAAASYTFTDDTITGRSAATYKASEFKIVSVGGTAVNGVFKQSGEMLDALCKYSSSATSAMTNPANITENVLEDFGVPSAKINATAQATCATTYDGWGLAWAGGLWYKEDRTKVLSKLLIQGNMQIIPRDTLIMRIRDATPVLIIEEVDILKTGTDANGRGGQNSYKCYTRNQHEEEDSLHVAYRPTGEPCDELIKILVPADASTDKPSSRVLDMPFVHNSQHAQALGTLAAQGVLNVKYDCEWLADPRTSLRVEVGDVVTLAGASYGGPVNVRITRRRISMEFDLVLRGTVYAVALKNWADLSPGAITPATDNSANVVKTVKETYVDPVTGKPATGAQVQGTIYLAPGADVILESSDTDPAITRYQGTSYAVEIGGDTDGDRFLIRPDVSNAVDCYIGLNGVWWGTSDTRFKNINMESTISIILQNGGYGDDYAAFSLGEDGNGDPRAVIEIYDDSEASTRDYYFFWHVFKPSVDEVIDLGASNLAWNQAWAVTWNNAADFLIMDSIDDIAVLKSIKGSGKIDQETGFEIIDDDTLPDWLLSKCKKTGKILRDSKGRPFIPLKNIISLLMGAIKELSEKIDKKK